MGDTEAFTPPSNEEALARLQMPLVDAIRTQRAVRRLHTEPVDAELLRELVELALKAPTSSNSQDWAFVIVTDPAQKRRIQKLYRPIWELGKRVDKGNGEPPEVLAKNRAPGEWQYEHFDELPALVIPCYRRNVRHHAVGWPQISVSSFYGSVYPAVQNLLLACRAMGLGASLQTLPIWFQPSARRILGLPRAVVPACVIPVGWARGKYGPTTRPPAAEVIHVDRFGHQPFR